jgi:lipopolysaccharide/colanic/teichoic acid biosynthesis glycosyltransferase
MRRETVHRDELMKPDLVCEILLALSGVVIFVPLLLMLALALAQGAALQ